MSSLDEIILSSYGGLEHNSLSDLIDDNDEVLKDKYPNFEVGLKCIIMVF